MSFLIFVILTAAAVMLWNGLVKIPVGWRGQILEYGKRVKGKTVEEGWNYTIPYFRTIEPRDCRNKVTKLDPISVFTSDNVLVDIEGSYVSKITNLYDYLDTDPNDIKKGIDDIRDSQLRTEVSKIALKDVLSFQASLGGTLLESIKPRAVKWGITVSEVVIASIRPNQKMAEALELKEKEKLQKEGENIELDNFADRVIKLMKPPPHGPGLSKEQAIEQVQIALGQLKKTMKAKSLSLDPAMTALAAAILEKISERNK